MKDLKHLLYFENLLQEAHNDLIAQAQNEGKICVAYACENTPEPLLNLPGAFSTRLRAPRTGSMEMATYYDMAWLTENMIMRNRTHGGYKVLLDELWEFCEQFNADMVILWEHMSCKALDGMHGLFEERAREHGIHLVWVTHDLFDPRVISRQGVRQQVNDYMRTVMQEEPVDPSLEILKDEKSW